jgi:hypothetical protein
MAYKEIGKKNFQVLCRSSGKQKIAHSIAIIAYNGVL